MAPVVIPVLDGAIKLLTAIISRVPVPDKDVRLERLKMHQERWKLRWEARHPPR
jgi:hypothetical protein